MSFCLTIPGHPVPKGRPRVVHNRTFTPRHSVDYEALVRESVALSWKREPLACRLAVTLRFYRGNARRCDIDNLVKAVLDALQGVIFQDDEQIDILYAEKHKDKLNPRVEVLVEWA